MPAPSRSRRHSPSPPWSSCWCCAWPGSPRCRCRCGVSTPPREAARLAARGDEPVRVGRRPRVAPDGAALQLRRDGDWWSRRSRRARCCCRDSPSQRKRSPRPSPGRDERGSASLVAVAMIAVLLAVTVGGLLCRLGGRCPSSGSGRRRPRRAGRRGPARGGRRRGVRAGVGGRTGHAHRARAVRGGRARRHRHRRGARAGSAPGDRPGARRPRRSGSAVEAKTWRLWPCAAWLSACSWPGRSVGFVRSARRRPTPRRWAAAATPGRRRCSRRARRG